MQIERTVPWRSYVESDVLSVECWGRGGLVSLAGLLYLTYLTDTYPLEDYNSLEG